MALLVVACVSVVVVAVSGAADPLSGLHFFASGHWVYNDVRDAAFHVDGATGNVNAEVPLGGQADPGSQVVQGDNGGYVVGQRRTVEFGKSDLKVTGVRPTASAEPALTLEVNGGPYAVYRESGKIVRFGDNAGPISIGGPVGDPVATSEGTVWLHRTDSGYLCRLSKDAKRPSCPAAVPRGHTGVLTVVNDRPVFVDTSAETMHLIDDGGLGEGVELGVDVPDDARAASRDVSGRVALLNRRDHKLHLIDSKPLTEKLPAEEPIDVPLADADYDGPASTGDAVAVVDRSSNTVETYDGKGEEVQKRRLRGKPSDRPLSTGEDGRVYADGEDGEHVVVVDHDGKFEEVPVAGSQDRGSGEGRGDRDDERPETREEDKGRSGPREDERRDRQDEPEDLPERETPPRQPEPPERPESGEDDDPPPTPASPPGAPADVSATAGDSSATVRWQPVRSTGGAAVTQYRVTWQGGSTTVSGSARSARVTGLSNGRGYVFTVAARNSAGTGPGADSQRVTPRGTERPDAPSWVDAASSGSAEITVKWTAAEDNGSPITGYRVSWTDPEGSGSADGSVDVPANRRSYVAEWLRGGTYYEFTVQAINDVGMGPSGHGDADAVCEDPEVYLEQRGNQSYVEIKCFDAEGDWDNEVRVRMYTTDDEEYQHTENVTLEDQHFRGTVPIDYPYAGDEVYVEVNGESGTYESNRITWE